MDAIEKRIHFGWFVRRRRERLGIRVKAFAAAAGIEPRTVHNIEQQEQPASYGATLGRIEKALGFKEGELDLAWRSEPVARPEKRPGPTPSNTRTLKLPATVVEAVERAAASNGMAVVEWLASAAKAANRPAGDSRMHLAAKKMGPTIRKGS